MRFLVLLLLTIPALGKASAQPAADEAAPPLRLLLPPEPFAREGEPLGLDVEAEGGADSSYVFTLAEAPPGADLIGRRFTWTPGFDVADRTAPVRRVAVDFEVRNGAGETSAGRVFVTVRHVNRPPEILPAHAAYAGPGQALTYRIVADDADGDPLVFSSSALPQNSRLAQDGTFTWSPSAAMVARLPIRVPFTVSDGEDLVSGSFEILRSQAAMAPQLRLVKGQDRMTLAEGEPVRVEVHVADPNGADDVAFVTLKDAPEGAAFDYRGGRGVFSWTPDYRFVGEQESRNTVHVTVLAEDMDGLQDSLGFSLTVTHRDDPFQRYLEYRTALASATSVLMQADEAHQDLTDQFRRAQRNLRNRLFLTAGLGLLTAVAGVLTKDNTQRLLTASGGASVSMLGLLEAKNAFTSPAAVEEKRGRAISETFKLADKTRAYAQKYSLVEQRQGRLFTQDTDALVEQTDRLLEELKKMGFDARPAHASDEDIRRYTVYFAPYGKE